MRQLLFAIVLLSALINVGCNSAGTNQTGSDADSTGANQQFADLETRFLDAYWKQYPSSSIFIGYGKYYENLPMPDSASLTSDINFSKQWLDSLAALNVDKLTDNNKISLNIIKNQLEGDIWYRSVFKSYQWNPAIYNLSGECDYIINQPYAPLDERLKILSAHLEHADSFFKVAVYMLHEPTKEHTELAIRQNTGGLALFGKSLSDSINASTLSDSDKTLLNERVAMTVAAITGYVDTLKTYIADKNYKFRSYRIGKELFTEKFKYDIVADVTPEQIYEKAMADKQNFHAKMFDVASGVWEKYYGSVARPTDSIELIQKVLDKVQLQHATPAGFYDTLVHQVNNLKAFILQKNLFDFDTANPPIIVRLMPEYARGIAVATAEFTPPYQKQGAFYFNIDDLTAYPPAKAESALKEYNDYASQFLSIHEAVPGHCLQGIYNNQKSPDIVRAVFQNGTMIEGWAVYAEDMMLENGWGNHAPEIELAYYKLKLREIANVLIDYDLQCLNKSEEDVKDLMVRECFQTEAQAEEKYHRATVSQVQLCSYYTGATAIMELRNEFQKKMGDQYSLKDFHEKFLSFGSSPVKYISQMMLK